MDYLEPGEEVAVQVDVLYERKQAKLYVTNERILVVSVGNGLERKIPLWNVSKFQRSKDKDTTDENSTSKLRVLYGKEESVDVLFKGVDCQKLIRSTLKHAKRLQEECEQRHAQEQRVVPDEEEEAPQEDDFVPHDVFLESNDTIRESLLGLADCGIDFGRDSPFWKNFQLQLTQLEIDPIHQKIGYAGALLTNIQADTDKKANQLNYNMTKSLKLQIRREQPQVDKKYREWVSKHKNNEYVEGISPEDDNEFWNEYFRELNRKRDRVRIRTPAAKEEDENRLFKDVNFDELASFHPESRTRRLRSLPCDVLSGQLHKSPAGVGLYREDWVPTTGQSAMLQKYGLESECIIEKINIHSEMVLIETGVIPDTTKPPAKLSDNDFNKPLGKLSDLDDLRDKAPPERRELQMNDSTAGPATVVDCAEQIASASRSFAASISSYRAAFQGVPATPQYSESSARHVVIDMTNDEDEVHDYRTMGFIPEMDMMRESKLQQEILLSAYWLTHYDTKLAKWTPVLREKLEEFIDIKMSERQQDDRTIAPLYDEMLLVHRKIPNPGERRRVEQLQKCEKITLDD